MFHSSASLLKIDKVCANMFSHIVFLFSADHFQTLHNGFQLLDTSIHLSTCCLMLEDVVFPSCTRCLVLLLSYIFWFHCCNFFSLYLLALKNPLSMQCLTTRELLIFLRPISILGSYFQDFCDCPTFRCHIRVGDTLYQTFDSQSKSM